MKDYILKKGSEEKALHEWGIHQMRLECLNLGNDTLSFIQDANNSIFIPEEKLSLWHGKKRLFEGIVTRSPIYESAKKKFIDYELKGPFWYLENTVYQQAWKEIEKIKSNELSFKEVYKSRIILGQSSKGERLLASEQIRDILNYAIHCGALFTIGDIELDFFVPMDELCDVSCAEALLRLLRWAPDALVTFDYTSLGNPRLNIIRKKTAKSLTLKMQTDGISQIKLLPRHDRQVPCVVLNYEKMHRLAGENWSSTEQEAYPPGSNGKEAKALVLTLELEGLQADELRQKIKTTEIRPNDLDWWVEHLPSLAMIKTGSLKIENINRKTDLPNELVEGAIAEWMNCDVQEELISARLSYETLEGSLIEHPVAIRLQATNAKTKLYTDSIPYMLEEAAPKGLAKELYESLSYLHYEGECILLGNDYLQTSYLGKTLSIKGGRVEWEKMSALIQGVTYQFDRDEVRLKLGPSSLLGADDLVELLRANRERKGLKRAVARALGRPQKVRAIKQATHTRLEHVDRGLGKMKRLVLGEGDRGSSIILDSTQLPDELAIEFKTESVCHNGILMKRWVLASQPFMGENKE